MKMDKSLNSTATSIVSCSPPKRRRSTFFERRDSLVPQSHQEIYTNHEENIVKENCKYEEEIARYMEKLTEERDKWKTEIKRRKAKHRELKLQLALTKASITQKKYDYTLLTDEDVQYINRKPNIAKLSESALDFNKKVKETLQFYKNLKEKHNFLLDFCELRLNAKESHILNNSSLGDDSDKTQDVFKLV